MSTTVGLGGSLMDDLPDGLGGKKKPNALSAMAMRRPVLYSLLCGSGLVGFTLWQGVKVPFALACGCLLALILFFAWRPGGFYAELFDDEPDADKGH